MSRLGLRLHADEEHWIPLSDMMTGLMFLFLIISLAYMVAADLKRAKPVSILKGYAASRAQIYSQLTSALGPNLQRWHASIDPATLSVRFSGNTGLFRPGSSELEPQFQLALNQFFPQYVEIMRQHQAVISELRIEGYTSTRWPALGTADGKYLDDMVLSQNRARNVLDYVMQFQSIKADLPWLMRVISADGFSFSHLVVDKYGAENTAGSDRVEFRAVSDANAKIAAALQLAPSAPPGPKPTPTPVPPPILAAGLPPYPVWAGRLIGTPMSTTFPRTEVRCYGYLDNIAAEYNGHPAGAQVSGWAFDLNAWRPIRRVLLVDARGIIVGAADGGYSRQDVQHNIQWVTSPNTGWRGSVAATQLQVTPWGVMSAPGTTCRLNVAAALLHDKL